MQSLESTYLFACYSFNIPFNLISSSSSSAILTVVVTPDIVCFVFAERFNDVD
jgi:hypothetical protein